MVVPYQIWMLQRVERAIERACEMPGGHAALESMLGAFPGGLELLDLAELLGSCRIRKEGARLFASAG